MQSVAKVEAASPPLNPDDKRRGRRFYITKPLQRGLHRIVIPRLAAEALAAFLKIIGEMGVIVG